MLVYSILVSIILVSIIILLLPLYILIAVVIFLHDFNNPIYKSTRVGKNAACFTLYKFRSMNVDSPKVESKGRQQAELYTKKEIDGLLHVVCH